MMQWDEGGAMKRTSVLKSSAAAALPLALIATLFAAGWLWSLSGTLGLQALGNWLTVPMRAITFLGDEQFYLIAIPLVYWCIHKELGADLAVLLLMSSFINGTLKSFIKHNRPFWEDARLQLDDAGSFSTPSGHSQTSAALFGYLAWHQANKRRGVLWIAILGLLILLVALSRVYLGVHFPGDVLWGAAIGLVLAALFARLKPALLRRLRRLSLGQHLALALAAAALIFGLETLLLGVPFGTGQLYHVLYPEAWRATLDEAATVAGLAFGLWFGLAVESRYVRFTVAGRWWQRVLRYLVGLIGLAAIWLGLRLVFPEEPLALGLALRSVRYGLAMLWAIVFWPWLFLKLGLAAAAEKDTGRER